MGLWHFWHLLTWFTLILVVSEADDIVLPLAPKVEKRFANTPSLFMLQAFGQGIDAFKPLFACKLSSGVLENNLPCANFDLNMVSSSSS